MFNRRRCLKIISAQCKPLDVRRMQKILLIIGIAIIILICVNYVTSNTISRTDEFLTELSVEETELEQQQSNVQNANHLLNLTNFQYSIANNLCQKYDKDILAIIIVTSYVGHDELRAAHRQAVPQNKLAEMGFQRVFLLAEIPAKERFISQKQIANEQQRFGDLVQGNFVEAYRNLSYKHIMGLRWAATECKHAKFIIKLDDDIIYDIFQLRRYLESLEVQQSKIASSAGLLAGFVLDSKPAIRNVANKWFVSSQEYPDKNYPAYLSGWLYITNPSTALRLVNEASKTSFFWIDDTWVTGILRSRLHIAMQRLNPWYSANAEFLDCCVRDLKQYGYECEYYVGPNGGDSKLLIEFLHNVEKCYFDECIKRPSHKALKLNCVAEAKHFVPEHGNAVVKQIKLR